jgi:ABC-type phosphate/phosphonate transport system permease subunit
MKLLIGSTVSNGRLPLASTLDAAVRRALVREATWRHRRVVMRLALGAVTIVVLWLSATRIRLNAKGLVEGIPNMIDFLGRMFPPDLSFLSLLIDPALETVQIAAWGTTLAVFASAPLALLAAHNTTPYVGVYIATRVFLNLLRSINELIYALILVSAVGLGPFPGVLAIALHATGMLAKFVGEEIEHVDRGQVEALQAAGAGRTQTIMFAILPQIIGDGAWPSWGRRTGVFADQDDETVQISRDGGLHPRHHRADMGCRLDERSFAQKDPLM